MFVCLCGGGTHREFFECRTTRAAGCNASAPFGVRRGTASQGTGVVCGFTDQYSVLDSAGTAFVIVAAGRVTGANDSDLGLVWNVASSFLFRRVVAECLATGIAGTHDVSEIRARRANAAGLTGKAVLGFGSVAVGFAGHSGESIVGLTHEASASVVLTRIAEWVAAFVWNRNADIHDLSRDNIAFFGKARLVVGVIAHEFALDINRTLEVAA